MSSKVGLHAGVDRTASQSNHAEVNNPESLDIIEENQKLKNEFFALKKEVEAMNQLAGNLLKLAKELRG
jgi:hypothetical protein